jgi:PQQ-dependent dehydrogenase (s-GDH family)
MKKPNLLLLLAIIFSIPSFSQQVDAGRMNEVFLKTDLATGLNDPWEITYGPDDSLWITEAKGYVVRKMSVTGTANHVILNLNTFPTVSWRKQYTGTDPNPQGGLMGLAVHPEFMTNPAKKFVYIGYVRDYVGSNVTLPGGEFVAGPLFTTWVVRWTYSAVTGQLGSPVMLCDTIRGSDDHNSGRMIIAPVGDSMYLFYAVGDQGGGQFGNITKVNKAQEAKSYEGKILRFRLEPDGDAGLYDRWIPSSSTVNGTNPFNAGGVQSAVWSTGIRNNQGFAFANVNGNDRLYGTSHGPFSDDELNVIEKQKNYGHPIVVGYNDGNYNGARAGQIRYPWPGGPFSNLPVITNENTNVNAINAQIANSYRDPIKCFYDTAAGSTAIVNSIQYIYNNTSGAYTANASWASEAPSGLGFYPYSLIPGWKNSLLLSSLKQGRILRLRVDSATGSTIIPIAGTDTASYFNSRNKFRDVAIDPNGKDIYTVIDMSPTTSGPGNSNPIVSACGGCVQKYTFLGYNNNAGASTISTSIPVGRGIVNSCKVVNTVNINANNTNLWVPITDDSSNVIAEIKANGNLLGNVTTSFYYKTAGAVREDATIAHHLYADRNLTITPAVQPSSNVDIRLYITGYEFNRLKNGLNSLGAVSGVVTINDVAIFKNNNTCAGAITSGAAKLTTTGVQFGPAGYVLTAATNAFSTFYFANKALTTLPVTLVSFTGVLNNNATDLTWTTATELNTKNYVIERSIDGTNYEPIGTVAAIGNSNNSNNYSYADLDASKQPAVLLYYRLKIYDNDDSYAYSNIVTVSLATIAGKVIVTPNPTAGITKVTLTAAFAGKGTWQIVDNSGRIVLQNTIQLQSGNNNITINASKIAAGLYYLNVSGPGIDQKVKLQKL